MAKKMVETLSNWRKEDVMAYEKELEQKQVKQVMFLSKDFEDSEVRIINQLY